SFDNPDWGEWVPPPALNAPAGLIGDPQALHRVDAVPRSESGNRASQRRLTAPDAFCVLNFGHCHILCSHDHRYLTSEFVRVEFINCMSFGGITTGADNVVLERTVIGREICCGAFREGIVATKYRQRNRVVFFMAKKADPCFLVDCPAFEMRQFKA